MDADDDNCLVLKNNLLNILNELNSPLICVLFRIVVEEIESWFIADSKAVERAYPSCNISKIENISPDAVIGAWEILAESIGKKPINCSGADKIEWALNISPHLDLTNPHSPSLITFIEGIDKVLTKGLGSKTQCSIDRI